LLQQRSKHPREMVLTLKAATSTLVFVVNPVPETPVHSVLGLALEPRVDPSIGLTSRVNPRLTLNPNP